MMQQIATHTERMTRASAGPAAREKERMNAGPDPHTRMVKANAAKGRVFRSGVLTRQNFFYRRPIGHPVAVVKDLWEPGGLNPIRFQPSRYGEKIGIANRVGFTHDPRALEIAVLDQPETIRHILWHFLFHRFKGGGIVNPAIAPWPVRMGHMNG